MATIDKVSLDIAVVLGTTSMPVHQVLRLGRGAIIELDAGEDDDITILANNLPVAKGTVVVNGNRIAVEVREMLPRAPDIALSRARAAPFLLASGEERRPAPRLEPSGRVSLGDPPPALVPAGPICYMHPVAWPRPVRAAITPSCGRGGIGRRASLRC